MSEYCKESGLYDGENKKVIGKFKDESPDEVIESFVGMRSKCYSFITKNNEVKKAKGVSKVVVQKNSSFDDYKNCVLNDTPCWMLNSRQWQPMSLCADAELKAVAAYVACWSKQNGVYSLPVQAGQAHTIH